MKKEGEINNYKEEVFNLGMLVLNIILIMGHKTEYLYQIYDQVNQNFNFSAFSDIKNNIY